MSDDREPTLSDIIDAWNSEDREPTFLEAAQALRQAVYNAFVAPLLFFAQIYMDAMRGDHGWFWQGIAWLYFLVGLWGIVYSALMTLAR